MQWREWAYAQLGKAYQPVEIQKWLDAAHPEHHEPKATVTRKPRSG